MFPVLLSTAEQNLFHLTGWAFILLKEMIMPTQLKMNNSVGEILLSSLLSW